MVDVRPAQAQPRWGRARRVTLWSCWGPRVPRLQVSRGVTAAADELHNGCVQKTGCLKVILERTMARSVPDWIEMWHSGKALLEHPDSSVRWDAVKMFLGDGCGPLRVGISPTARGVSAS